MTSETVLGAGGLHSDWAVWGAGMAEPAKDAGLEESVPLPIPRAGDEAEVLALKANIESLERENVLLRQRLALADRQVEVKDSQINDFKAIAENLTRQNQVLLMLAQGVPMERIMKGGAQEIEVQPGRSGRSVGERGGTGKADVALRKKIASRLRELLVEGMTNNQMAQALNEESLPTLSGKGKWDSRKISKYKNDALRHGERP